MFPPDQDAAEDESRPLLACDPEHGLQAVQQQEQQGKARSARQDRRKQAPPSINAHNWLRIDKDGSTSMMQADKYRLAYRLGVQVRDLRIVDPAYATTYPSAILCRERALIVNLEQIKLVITMDSVLVVNPDDENVLAFLTELKQKLAQQPSMHASTSYAASLEDAAAGPGTAAMEKGSLQQLAVKLESLATLNPPFELRVLEVCLDFIASHFHRLASDLEAAAYPALDDLTRSVTTSNLERVRRIKGRLVRLTTRVQTVREVLEDFLEDDDDMRCLNLTSKQHNSSSEQAGHDVEGAAGGMHSPQQPGSSNGKNGSSRCSSSSSSESSSVVEQAVAQVEMLLEAYFMHLDNTFNRLQTLNEYIEDTEDLVNLKLDQHRNQLIGIDLLLTAFNCALGMMTVSDSWWTIAAAWHTATVDAHTSLKCTEDSCGMPIMNLAWKHFNEEYFVIVTAWTVLGAIGLLTLFLAFLARRNLLSF